MTNEEKALQIRTLQREEPEGSRAWIFYEGMLTVLLQKGAWNLVSVKASATYYRVR